MKNKHFGLDYEESVTNYYHLYPCSDEAEKVLDVSSICIGLPKTEENDKYVEIIFEALNHLAESNNSKDWNVKYSDKMVDEGHLPPRPEMLIEIKQWSWRQEQSYIRDVSPQITDFKIGRTLMKADIKYPFNVLDDIKIHAIKVNNTWWQPILKPYDETLEKLWNELGK